MKPISARSLVLWSWIVLAGLSRAQSARRAIERTGETSTESPAFDEAWSGRAAEGLRRMEYHFTALEPDVFSAPNRAQGLRSRVSVEGLEVFPRSTGAEGDGASWRVFLRTTRFGRAGDPLELTRATVSVREDRAELDHGCLVEWFENREEGIEQGWTIETRLPGSAPLWIGLAIGGDLSLRIDEGARSARFVDVGGEAVLHYRGLQAFDAAGRELEARLSSGQDGCGIEIDDAGAVYPLLVDPVLTGPAWTAEGDQAGAGFGWSVAPAGDVNGDGYSDVIVGAPGYDNGESEEGRAFVYLGSASGPSTSPTWTAESDQATPGLGPLFGHSVSTAGDVNGDGYSDVVVGAPNYDNGELDEGRAYVYHGSAGGLSTSAAWTAESDQSGAGFAGSVAGAGDVNGDGYDDVVVGADAHANGESGEGRAFVYHGSAAGLATSPAWTAEGDQVGAEFGHSVATAGDVNGDGYADVVVGALFHDNGSTDEGRASVFLGSAAGLSTSTGWTAEGDQASAAFGSSVASAGDVNGDGYGDVVIGAVEFDNGEAGEGRAFLYLGSAGGLSSGADWTAESDQGGALFGHSVAGAGDVDGDGYGDLIVGARDFDAGEADEGRASIYHGSAAGLAAAAAWTAETGQGAWFGYSVATAGDVDGDGYGDVVVGAIFYDNGQPGEGRAFLYDGTASGLSTTASWMAESNDEAANFGYSVASAGDVNGDGYGDVIVAAHGHDGDLLVEGAAFVYHGSASGLSSSAAWTAETDQAFARVSAVSGAGDVNGDGYGDVVVGSYRYDNGQTDEGRAFVYHGSSTGLATAAAWTAEGNQGSAFFGWSVSTAGDVDGDGYSDVIIGALWHDNGQVDEGRAYLYHGSASGLSASFAWRVESNRVGANLGKSVATAGDVNGDGYSDVIVGAHQYSNGESGEGRAFVYHGAPGGLSTSAAWTAESDQDSAAFGNSVSTAGDVDGDGYSDVIVGAHLYDNGESDEGRAFVYRGSSTGLAPSASWTAEGDQESPGANLGDFGFSVGAAGDVNGDGYGDVIVGAHLYDNDQTDEGRALVYLGNEGRGGLVRLLQQRRSNDSAPIALLGRTGLDGVFRVRAEFPRNLAGVAWATPEVPLAFLEWEVKPLGTPLDGTDVQTSAGQALQPAGGTVVFDEPALVLDSLPPRIRFLAARSIHWRARIATNNPLFPHTAWFSIPGNCITEAKLRKPAKLLQDP